VGSWLDGFWQPKRLKARDALKRVRVFWDLCSSFVSCSVADPLPRHPVVGGVAPAAGDAFVFAAVDGVVARVTSRGGDGADLRLDVNEACIHPSVADWKLGEKE